MGPFVSLNKDLWTFASGIIFLAGDRFRGLQNLDPSEELKKEAVYGNGSVAIGRARGQHSAATSMEMIASEYNFLLDKLGTNFGGAQFNVSATYTENNGDGSFYINLSNVEITKVQMKQSNDGKALIASIELSVIEPIDWNGKKIIELEDDFDFASFGLSLSF